MNSVLLGPYDLFLVGERWIALLLCQAKGDTLGFCLEKLCVPHPQEDWMKGFITMSQRGVSKEIRVCVGLALLNDHLRFIPVP